MHPESTVANSPPSEEFLLAIPERRATSKMSLKKGTGTKNCDKPKVETKKKSVKSVKPGKTSKNKATSNSLCSPYLLGLDRDLFAWNRKGVTHEKKETAK